MNQVYEFFSRLFSVSSWPARWYCGRWTPFHGWLYIISSVLIALAYFSIPVILYYLIRKTKNRLPFQKIFWLFLLFILACGVTHVFDAVMFWLPAYRVSAIVLLVTAIVSWLAVIGLFKILPTALTLQSPAMLQQVIQERTAQLEVSNRELQMANQELKMAKLATEQLMKEKDEFIGVASHELKTPLTSIKAYNQLLAVMSTGQTEEINLMHNKMGAQINRLTYLINDLLDVTRIESGGLLYNKTPVNLSDCLSNAVDDMQRTVKTHTIEIEQLQEAMVMADPERIAQVITNLLSNAVKYADAGTSIQVNLFCENGFAVCSVQDAGLGIPIDQHPKIFEKFYRVSGKNRHTYPGLGLGLHISRDIITKHDGDIWLTSEEGKGSVFYFSLPLNQSTTSAAS